MKVTKVKLKSLPSKHYSTNLSVTIDDDITFDVEISGLGTKPSARELENGWEPDFGMNHTESEEHLFIAYEIMKALGRV